MKKHNDNYIEPQPTEQERAAIEAEAQLRAKVRDEVMRIQSGDADEDIAREQQQANEQREQREREQRERELKRKRRDENPIWLLLSGDILLKDGIKRYYRNMIAMALIFFVSILVMFTALHLDVSYSHLEREVQLLREHSLELQTERFQRCSHTSISSELERRGIKLEDPTAPSMIIE